MSDLILSAYRSGQIACATELRAIAADLSKGSTNSLIYRYDVKADDDVDSVLRAVGAGLSVVADTWEGKQ
jgi:hypothetical protein